MENDINTMTTSTGIRDEYKNVCTGELLHERPTDDVEILDAKVGMDELPHFPNLRQSDRTMAR